MFGNINRLFLIFGFLSFSGLPSFLHAEELTLSEALTVAENQSPQQVQAALMEEKAKAQSSALSSQLLPQVSGVGRYTASDDSSTNLPDDNEAILQVQQNLLPFLSPDWIRAGAQGAQTKAAQIDRVSTGQDVDLLVKQLYFSILRDQDIIGQTDEVTGEFQTLLNYLTPQFTVGRIPRFDQVKVKAALSDLARSKDLTLAQLVGEKAELAQILGLKSSEDLILKTLTTMPVIPDLSVGTGLGGNPTLQALGQRVEAARISLDADNFARLPSVTAHFIYGYQSQSWDTLGLGWDAGVELRLPIFDWGGISAQTDQDRADWQLAQNFLESRRQQLMVQFQQTRATVQANFDDQKRLEGLLPETEQASHAAIRQYRTGAMGIVETTDAVNLWLTTSLNERNAYYSYLVNLSQLEWLMGGQLKVNYE